MSTTAKTLNFLTTISFLKEQGGVLGERHNGSSAWLASKMLTQPGYSANTRVSPQADTVWTKTTSVAQKSILFTHTTIVRAERRRCSTVGSLLLC